MLRATKATQRPQPLFVFKIDSNSIFRFNLHSILNLHNPEMSLILPLFLSRSSDVETLGLNMSSILSFKCQKVRLGLAHQFQVGCIDITIRWLTACKNMVERHSSLLYWQFTLLPLQINSWCTTVHCSSYNAMFCEVDTLIPDCSSGADRSKRCSWPRLGLVTSCSTAPAHPPYHPPKIPQK